MECFNSDWLVNKIILPSVGTKVWCKYMDVLFKSLCMVRISENVSRTTSSRLTRRVEIIRYQVQKLSQENYLSLPIELRGGRRLGCCLVYLWVKWRADSSSLLFSEHGVTPPPSHHHLIFTFITIGVYILFGITSLFATSSVFIHLWLQNNKEHRLIFLIFHCYLWHIGYLFCRCLP